MVIDASIPLGFKMPQFLSPADAQGKALSLQQLQQTSQANDLDLQQRMQALADQQQVSSLAMDPRNIDTVTGGFTADALTQVNNPMVRQKLNQERIAALMKAKEIENKTGDVAAEQEKRKSEALTNVFSQAYSAYESTLQKTGDEKLATEKFNKIQNDGFEEIRATGKGGFGKDTQFKTLTPEEVGYRLVSHKERMAQEEKTKDRESAAQTPLMKEVTQLQKLKGKLADLRPGDPGADGLREQIGYLKRNIDRMNAPTVTEFKLGNEGREAAQAKNLDGLVGDELLSALSVADANMVKAVSEGRMTLSSLGMRGKERERVARLLSQFDPTYDEAEAKARYRTMSDFSTGKNGNTVRSLNVAIHHLGTLQEAADALKNGNTQVFNKLGNAIASQTGAAAPTDFAATKKIVADEIVKAVVGSGGGVSDREEAAKTIAAANSPAQLRGVINRYKDLMGGQVLGLKKQYEANTKRKDFDDRFLEPETRTQLYGRTKSEKGAGTGKTETVPNPMQSMATATNPATGEKLVFKDGKWEPIK